MNNKVPGRGLFLIFSLQRNFYQIKLTRHTKQRKDPMAKQTTKTTAAKKPAAKTANTFKNL